MLDSGTIIIRYTQDFENEELEEFLKTHKESVNNKDIFGKTAFFYAVEANNMQAIDILLQYPLDFSLIDEMGFTVLHYAAIANNRDLVVKLLDEGCSPLFQNEQDGMDILHIFASYSDYPIVELLLQKGANVQAQDHRGYLALHYAAQVGAVEILELLYKAHPKTINQKDHDGKTPLVHAIEKGYLETVISLLELGADIYIRDESNSNLIHSACYSGNTRILEIILSKNPEVNHINSNGLMPLHICCAEGFLDIARVLLHSGADVNAQTPEMLTPLHYATSSGNADLVSLLLEFQAQPNLTNIQEEVVPLHYAALHGSLEMMILLVKADANVNAQNHEGNTPLMFALAHNYILVVKFLIENGADVNLANRRYQSPLSLAVLDKNIETTTLLLQSGADQHKISHNGLSVKEWVNIQGPQNIKEILERYDEENENS